MRRDCHHCHEVNYVSIILIHSIQENLQTRALFAKIPNKAISIEPGSNRKYLLAPTAHRQISFLCVFDEYLIMKTPPDIICVSETREKKPLCNAKLANYKVLEKRRLMLGVQEFREKLLNFCINTGQHLDCNDCKTSGLIQNQGLIYTSSD